jgi:DNA processing protein
MNDSELVARILLNVSIPANEGRLRKYLFELPVEQALDLVQNATADQRWLDMALNRARARLGTFNLASSLKAMDRLRLEIVSPSDISGIEDLGSQAPWILFSTAKFASIDFTAVVGTRSHTATGAKIAEQLISQMGVSRGLVSGGANGIDLSAHLMAKSQQVPQLMVLAGGLDSVYPKKASELIREGFLGAAISEMPPGVKSGKLGFLNRNRLIAAICNRLFLVEAPEVSGSINTAQHALNISREVTVCLSGDPEFSPGGQWMAKKAGVKTQSFEMAETG